MAQPPVTSITLLKDLARGTDNARWTEFVRIYEGPMRAFLAAHYPSVEADDVIQETLIALMRRLPDYHCTPDAHGHFRNYLCGILKHKAQDVLAQRTRESNRLKRLGELQTPAAAPAEDDDWKAAAMEVAVEQLMSDTSVNARTREIFRHVALLHEPAEAVAAQFGVTRNNVDQIKSRLIARLSERITALTA